MASKRTTTPTYYESIANGARNAFNKAPFYFFLGTVAPFGATFFLANAGIQSFKSGQRIQEHAEGKSGIAKDKYKVELMIEGAQRQAEKIMEGFAAQEGQDYLPEGKHPLKDGEEAQTNGHAKPPKPAAEEDHLAYGDEHCQGEQDYGPANVAHSTAAPPAETLPSYPSSLSSKKDEGVEFPTLALTADQFKMKEALDAVGFRKYPVHIKRANHSHAAIIVRYQRPGFGEGRIVARHWLERFEI